MIQNKLNTRRGALSLVVAAFLLSGCQVTISDPIEEPAAIEPTATVVAVAAAPAAEPTRRPRATRTPRGDTLPPTVTLTPTITPTPRSYEVVQGDTLGVIARRFEIAVPALMAANSLNDGDTLSVGQSLVIPSASQIVAVEAEAGTPVPTVHATDGNPMHFVKVGETLSAIATQYGIARDDLLAANGLRPDAQLTAGEMLIIPTGAYTPVPTATPLQSTPVPTIEVVIALPSVTATAESAPAATPTAVTSAYVVQEGDYAGVIAREAGVSVAELKEANPGVDLDRLAVGQSLVIPATSGAAPTATSPAIAAPPTATSSATPTPIPPVIVTHVVREGETFESVAAKYKVSVEVIKQRNPGVTGELTPEAVIEVPIGTPTPTPTRVAPATATALSMPYQAPVLLAPTDNTVWIHTADKTPPMLLWTSVGILNADEFYVVRLRALDTDGNLLWSMSHWTQTANWRLPNDIVEKIEGRVLLRWDVMVMLRTSKEGVEPVTGEALSNKSESYTIRFNK